MQLKRKSLSTRQRLIAASCALLGATAARGQDAEPASTDGTQSEWAIDSALAYYHESGRIRAIEPVVEVRKDYGDGRVTSFNLTFDSLSGSSPNGALPSNKAQTFASPSGKSLSGAPQSYTTASGQTSIVSAPIYTVAPGQLPADPNYHDQRLALGGNWALPLSRLTLANVGGKLSYEHDFLSLSVNGSVAHDFNDKNTTLSLGFNGEFDSVKPIGGAPVAASDYALFQKTGGKSKHGEGLVLGLTQVMSRRWLTEFNLSVDRFSGYLNDPYKIISVIDSSGNTTGYLYEKRPSERMRRSAYLENRVGWDRASAALSLRYMTDDWHLHSDTAEFRLRYWNLQKDRYIEPSVRWYKQSAADFYAPWLSSSAAQIGYASADSRLGALNARTYGLKYAAKGEDGSTEISVRLEYYRQTMTNSLAVPAALQGLDLFPGLKAFLLQFGYRF